ncbi:MAG: sensor histidine kinase [Flavobacterium sp.]|jgi:signal transduction histidine kinase
MESKNSEGIIIAIFVLLGLSIFIIILFLLFIKKKNDLLLKQKKARKIHEKEIITTQLEIKKETLKQLGAEIHDNVGQQITLASLLVQQIIYENNDFENEKLKDIDKIIKDSLNSLRKLSKSLVDDSIETDSICKLIQKECKKISMLKKYKIDYICNDEIYLKYDQKIITLRTVQEFLQNSLKHSNCKKITIEITKLNNEFRLIIQDDGIGFDTTLSSNGIGLYNIKKRIKVLEGNCLITSRTNHGTKLEITYNIES